MKKIGVLALQGDFELHIKMLETMGAPACEVRTPADLRTVGGLIIPGGETTTMDRLLRFSGLDKAVSRRFRNGTLPVYGTCMGMILTAREIEEYPELFCFGFIDMKVARNAYGRQVDSFEADVKMKLGNGANGKPFNAVFIRAPQVVELGAGVEVYARHNSLPILMSQGNCLAGSFHPELTDDSRVHKFFIDNFVEA